MARMKRKQHPKELWRVPSSTSEHANVWGRSDEEFNIGGIFKTINTDSLSVVEIDEDDEKALAAFLPSHANSETDLAELILKKIKEKCAEVSSDLNPLPKLDNHIIDLLEGTGPVLSRYTSGVFLKVIQRIASLEHWEKVLFMTEPEKWSPHSLCKVTQIFTSKLKENETHRFCKLVLLPRVRYEIQKNKRLHPTIYEALKKTLFKSSGFFQGILFPLCKKCTRMEAKIIGSIIQKASIRVRASSTALVTLANMDYNDNISYFMKLLIQKKYRLEYEVLNQLVAHFMRFLCERRDVHVEWHQALLVLVQRYKHELTKEDKDNLYRLMQCQEHHLITPEIFRELKNSRNRGEESELPPIPLTAAICSMEEDRLDIPQVPMEDD